MSKDANIIKIQQLYKKIDSKKRFFALVGGSLKRSPAYVRVQYFGLWNIPVKHHEKIKELLNDVVKLQIIFNTNYKSLENK